MLASLGIYLFRFAVLREVLGEDDQRQTTHDLSRAILLGKLGRYRGSGISLRWGERQCTGLLARWGHHRRVLAG